MSEQSDDIDLAAVAADISAAAARRRASSQYSQGLVDRLALPFTPSPVGPAPEDVADLERTRPLTARSGPMWVAVIGAKRVIRRAVGWYVRPLAHDQTSYNYAVLRRL